MWTEGDYLCRGAWLRKLSGARNWYAMDVACRKCVVNLEKVVNANIDMRPFTDDEGGNPLPPRVQRTLADGEDAWCMSDSDYLFLMDETQLREDICEYDIGEANTVLQKQHEEQQWHATNDIDI